MDASRRGFLLGLTAFVAAPAIVRVAANLMPISTRAILAPSPEFMRIVKETAHGKLVLSDTRYVSNMDKADAPDLFELAAKLLIQTDEPLALLEKTRIEVTRGTQFWMDVQAMRSRNVLMSIQDRWGSPAMTFRGVPIHLVDA